MGYWAVQHFQAVNLLKEPIAPFLTVTGGKLVVTSPTEAVMITLKLALVVGLVLVSPYHHIPGLGLSVTRALRS